VAFFIGFVLTVTLIALPAIFDPASRERTSNVTGTAPAHSNDPASAGAASNQSGNAPAYWTAFAVFLKVCLGVAVLVVGIVGDLVAKSLQDSLDRLPRDATHANKNHHLAGIVGESIRVLLLLLVESKPPPDGMSREEFPQSVTDAAKPALADMAAAATEFWRGLVLDADRRKVAPFAGLHEPALSTFIIDPQAPAMTPEAWERFLNDLYVFARKHTDTTAVPFAHPADRAAAVQMLGAQFGRSFHEALKWDSTHDGLGWAAMQLQIAGATACESGRHRPSKPSRG